MRNNEELYKKLENFIPNHKLGFKILKDDQLQNIFPTYESLIQKIDKHRENLNKHERISGLDSQYNLMYDNVYSIMGERGSGKTSALFTLKKKIEMLYPTDWVLPVIMPELIPETGDIIGWILATLEEVVKELEEKIENNHNIRGDRAYFRDCKFMANNELRVAYEKVKDLHFSKKLPQYQTESFSTAMESNQVQALNGFEFSKAFSTFWNALVDAIVKADKDSSTNTKEKNPLIYLMFDDVDLAPERIMDLLSAIIKYLAHPNLIVIITAEEELFYEVVSKELSRTLDSDTMKKTAQLYVDKVMPPSSRFYLKKFDDCRKKGSFIQNAEGSDKEIHSENLEAFLRNKVNEYIETRSMETMANEYDNFLYYEGDEKQFLQIYFLYWGNTSRQLVNESLIVADLIDSLKLLYSTVTSKKLEAKQYKKQYEEQVYERIQGFIKSSIQSNLELREMIKGVDEFVNRICNRNKTRWPIFINYEALEKFYFEQLREETSEENSEKNKKRILENVIAVFVLLFFVENLLLIGDRVNDEWRISKERKYIHGAEYLVSILDSLLPDSMSLTRNSGTSNAVAEMLYNYENILCNPMWLKKFSIYDYLDVKDYLYPLYTKAYRKRITFSELNKWHTENPRWFTTMTKMVFLMSSGVFSITKRTTRVFQWEKKIKIYDSYLIMMTNLEKEKLKQQLINSFRPVKTEVPYQAYFDLMRGTDIFQKIEDELFYSGDIYFLEEIKENMMGIAMAEIDARNDLLNNGIVSYEEFLRVCAFLHVSSEDIWKYNLLTKDIIKNELQRIQNELVGKYSTFSTYYIKDTEKLTVYFEEIQRKDVSLELIETAKILLDVMKSSETIQSSLANRLVELLDKEICYDDPFSYRETSMAEKCKKVLQENLKLAFEDEETENGMQIVILHEAQLYLQEMYAEMLLNEMKDVLKDQGLVASSFYSKYMNAMLEVLENSDYNNIGNLSMIEVEQRVYLGKYIQEVIRETVEKYIAAEELVISNTNGETVYE